MKTCILLLLFFAGPLVAQQSVPSIRPQSFGQVIGRVYCQDTGRPGRFAGVQLLPEKASKEPGINLEDPGKNPNFATLMAKAFASVMKRSNLSTVTELDGTFSLDKVLPGTYYVIPQLAGYRSPLSEFSQTELMNADETTLALIKSTAQKVVVAGDQTTNIVIELERGATLSGAVTYDDGSPAPGITPELLVLGKEGKWKKLGGIGAIPRVTDDRGQFRFFGLPAGKYAVMGTLPTTQAITGVGPGSISMHMGMGDALVVYSGGVFREEELKPIELGTGDERNDVEIIFPINGLHTVSGHIVAKSDSHAVNAGSIELQDATSKAILRIAMVDQDGTFQMKYVPDGAYVLKVTGAADTQQKRESSDSSPQFDDLLNSKELKPYGTVEQSLIVKSDVLGLVLRVPDEIPSLSK